MVKRAFFLAMLLICISTILSWAQDEQVFKITHGPYLQNVTETGATIVFSTDKLVAPGIMIRSGAGAFELIQNSHEGLMDVGDNIHKVRIENLNPGRNTNTSCLPVKY